MKCEEPEIAAAATMSPQAERVAGFLKGLANRDRLLVLCAMAETERSVSSLIAATGIAPSSMSQHLAKLKAEGLVAARREHRVLFYRIAHPAVLELIGVLHRHFCAQPLAD